MRTIFFGYRKAGSMGLERLVESGEKVCSVVTSDDRKDTKPQFAKSVREVANKYHIPVFMPEKSKDPQLLDFIRRQSPDIMLSMFYNKLIDIDMIKACGQAYNFHGGKLPEYRGCNGNIWPILNEDITAVVTAHKLTEKFDEGDIVGQKTTLVLDTDTGKSLYMRMTERAVELMSEVQAQAKRYMTIPRPQIGKPRYYTKKIPHNGELNQEWDGRKVYNFVRALYFPPFKPAWFKFDNTVYYVYGAKYVNNNCLFTDVRTDLMSEDDENTLDSWRSY